VTTRSRLLAAGLAALVVAAAVGLALHRRGREGGRGASPARALTQRPAVKLNVAEVPPEPSVWVDVHAPDKVWKALRTNAWLGRAAGEPLGQGLAAGWSGFLGTKGSDLAGAFDGAVLDLVADQLLTDPFRLVFFAGPAATGAPALVVPAPGRRAVAAFELLEAAARNGSFEAPRCPGPEPAEQKAPAPPPIVASRWILAEHSVYAGQRDGRLALGRSPTAVIQALCAAPPDVPAAQGIDVSVSFSPGALGRESQLAALLLGLGPAPRLAFALEGDRLVPAGLLGAMAEPGRLAAEAPPDALLKLVPAEAGVVLVANLRLPEPLDRASLRAHLEKKYAGKLATRPIAIVWNPRGDPGLPTEVAVAWPDRDAAFLKDAFSGPNVLERRRGCGQEVLASTGALANAMLKGCQGKAPTVLDGAPAAAAGLRAPSSLAIGVNLGVTLSRLVQDSWAAEAKSEGKPKTVPEIDAARRLLEELPYLGLRGRVDGAALVPGGFRS